MISEESNNKSNINDEDDLYERVKKARSNSRDRVRVSPLLSAGLKSWDADTFNLAEQIVYEKGTIGYVTQNRKLYDFNDYIEAVKLKGMGQDLHQKSNAKQKSAFVTYCIVS